MTRRIARPRSIATLLLTAASATPLQAESPHALAFVITGDADALFATTVAAADDLDGDGVPDLLVRSILVDDTELITVHSGTDDSIVAARRGASGHPWIGTPMDATGDLDGDGTSDLIVGDAYVTSAATVTSGASGARLLEIPAPDGVIGFGGTVRAVGDLDGDGRDDLFVGRVATNEPDAAVVVRVKDGAILLDLDADDAFGGVALGNAVAPLGDVDGDGVPDLVVGALRDGPVYQHPGIPPFVPPFELRWPNGSAIVFSGADGRQIHRILASEVIRPETFGGFGFSVAAAGDVDADGVPDVIIGSESADPSESAFGGFARVHSGADGSLIHSFLREDGADDRFVAVAGLGDLDDDGHDDLLVASTVGGLHAGAIRIFSGVDGALLQTIRVTSPLGFGRLTVAVPGDLDGDGRADFAVGVAEAAFGAGRVEIYLSGLDG